MSDLFISVIMPVYNASLFIKEAIDSVLNQTYKNFELIIIDDGSTDDSVLIIKTFQDKRIKLIYNEHNFIDSLNIGLLVSHGKYIVRMDADDIMLPDRLNIQLNYMELHPNIAVSGSYAKKIGDSTGIVKTETSNSKIISSMLLYNPMTNPTVIFRRSLLGKHLYVFEYPYAEDYKLWTDMAKDGLEFANIPKVLLLYRCSSRQVTYAKREIMYRSTKKIQLEYAEYIVSLITTKYPLYFDSIYDLVYLFKVGCITQFTFLEKVYFIYQNFLFHTSKC